MQAISEVPPPMSITILPIGASTSRPAPSAAAIGSKIIYTSRPPARSAESRTARISTLVEPEGIPITILSEGEKRWPLVFTLLTRPRISISAAVKSAITPSFNGRIVRILGLVRSCIILAAIPTATTFCVRTSIATIEGSSTTTLPLCMIRVLAVPRSIANSCVNEKSPIVYLLFFVFKLDSSA